MYTPCALSATSTVVCPLSVRCVLLVALPCHGRVLLKEFEQALIGIGSQDDPQSDKVTL